MSGTKSFLVLKELSRYKVETYADIIYRNSIIYKNEMAFKFEDHVVTFGEFNRRINRLAHGLLSLDLKKGDVLGVLSWNRLEYTDVYGVAMKYGFIISPFNPRLKERELEYLIDYSDCKILFVDNRDERLTDMVLKLMKENKISKVLHCFSFGGDSFEIFKDYKKFLESFSDHEINNIQADEDDPVFIFYTSGTTGIPRGALYTVDRSINDTKRFIIGLGIHPGDIQIQIMPLFHVGGAKNLLGYYCIGASNVILPQISFDPRATLKAIQDEKATDIHIVATHLATFFSLPDVDTYDLSSLKRMFYAASPMPFELLKKGMEKWGPIFVQFYGSTEDGPNVTMLSVKQHTAAYNDPSLRHTLTSAGFPHLGVHVRIVDEQMEDLPPRMIGEIVVYSKGVLKEWWKSPEDAKGTITDGWVHTGDMGYYDEDGYIYIVDRKKDMICSGGENIYPREVEEVLYQHPKVKEACVIGVPDDYWVERVHALIVLKEGEVVTEKEIMEFCKGKIARYKAPKTVEFVESLPKTPSGKILKRELREKYWTGKDRKVC